MSISIEDRLLLLLQEGLPLTPRPFADLGAPVGASEAEVVGFVERQLAAGHARRLGAVFDARRLGYRSLLCAARIDDPAAMAAAAERLAPVDGITHCYERGWPAELDPDSAGGPAGKALPNFWFTLAAPRGEFDRSLEAAEAALAPAALLALPARTRFKIDVVFDPAARERGEQFPGATRSPGVAASAPVTAAELTETDRAVVRLLQGHLAPAPDLFAQAAARLGLAEPALLDRLRAWQAEGVLRRFALVVRHRELGFKANAMCTWDAPADVVGAAGRILASFPEVTHCYERARAAGFGYNLYAMIHTGSWGDTQRLFLRLSQAAGLQPGRMLCSLREFKKTSMIYFGETGGRRSGMSPRAIHQERVFPVGLLLEGKPCLVVGGGKVAARKVRLLLDAGARVTVVSPELDDDLRALATEGAITHLARPFEPADVAPHLVVFAGTNACGVNRQVLESAREAGRLCCAVDVQWPDGSFVTPATFRHNNLTVSVTTGGRSCRQSRLVRDNLARHIEMLESTDLVVLGTSHEQLSIRQRESYHLAGDRLETAGRLLMQVWGVQEFTILNTCNRVELLAIAACQENTLLLLKRILRLDALHEEAYYVKTGLAAFEHLALLTAGLYSQTPGEYHIVAQVKDAVATARQAGWCAGLMDAWHSAALHVSKHVRAATAPLLKSAEIEDQCAKYIKRQGLAGAGRTAAILGAGVVGAGLVERCAGLGLTCHWYYHINRPEVPPALAGRVTVASFNGLRDGLRAADLVLCAATGGVGHLLHAGHAPFFDQEKNVVIIDLGMPRNVAPEIEGLGGNLRIVDLDDLKHWCRRELADLEQALDLGRREVRAHRELYDKLIKDIQGGDAV